MEEFRLIFIPKSGILAQGSLGSLLGTGSVYTTDAGGMSCKAYDKGYIPYDCPIRSARVINIGTSVVWEDGIQ